MKKNFFITVIILLLGTTLVFAQDTSSYSPCIGFSEELAAVRFNNLTNLNNSLKLFNYPRFSDYGFEFRERLLLGHIRDLVHVSIETGFGEPISNGAINNITSKLTIMDEMTNVNFNLSYKNDNGKRKFFFEPFLGFGVTVSTLTISNNSNNSQPFDSTIKVLSGQKQVTNIAYLINLGMAVQKSISKDSNWFLGLRAGYEFQINQPKWMLNNNSLSNNPKSNLGGLYVGLSISYY